MLCDVSELSSLLAGSENIEHFLQRTALMVATHLDAHVCSIYLYEEASEELVLTATMGLNQDAVGRVRMKRGEGLVGTVMDILKPILEKSGENNPNFKYFKEANEDSYTSFLAVPIQRGKERIGVLAVQHEQVDYFNEIDMTALQGIAAQLAGAIENVRLLMNMDRRPHRNSSSELLQRLRFVKVKSASEGCAFGLSVPFVKGGYSSLYVNSDDDKDLTIEDFHRAVKVTGDQLCDLQKRISEHLPEAASLIFESHQMILKDEGFIRRVGDTMCEGIGVTEAVRRAAKYYIQIFSSSAHSYMTEKTEDIEDLAKRIIGNLRPDLTEVHSPMAGRIVIAQDLYPSDILRLAVEDVRAVILVSGGMTSHIAILSRSLQIPLVIAEQAELLHLPKGIPILVDADIGNVYIDPSVDIIETFEKKKKVQQRVTHLAQSISARTETRDGTPIQLMANINILGELAIAQALQVDGIGLYRTEFPFLVRSNFPSEEEQFLVYRRVFSAMPGRRTVIRTLDLAGDKIIPFLDKPRESNPQLGLRSTRFMLAHKDIFQQQLRAILRAAAGHEICGIMFPLISSLDEFLQARKCLDECMDELASQGLSYHETPQVGMMVELPAIVEIADDVAEEADFSSIGTNDFVQYMLAADRNNEQVESYYQPYHPSVLRALKRVVDAHVCRGKDISVCGETAHEFDYLRFLVGIGVKSLSVDPRFIPSIRRSLADFDMEEACCYAEALLSKKTISGVFEEIDEYHVLSYPPEHSHGSCHASRYRDR